MFNNFLWLRFFINNSLHLKVVAGFAIGSSDRLRVSHLRLETSLHLLLLLAVLGLTILDLVVMSLILLHVPVLVDVVWLLLLDIMHSLVTSTTPTSSLLVVPVVVLEVLWMILAVIR